MTNRRNYLRFALLASWLLTASLPARAATDELQVPFDTIPTAAQNALTDYAAGLTNGASASAWRGTLNGRVVYTGRVTDVDGTMRIIDVDAQGHLLGLRMLPRGRSITPPY